MSELTTNLLNYQPDPDMLRAKFRYWHVEALLNQSQDLIEKCLENLREYLSLDNAWNIFQTNLDAQIKELEFDLAREAEGVQNRDLVVAQEKKAFFNDSAGNIRDLEHHALKLNDFQDTEGVGKPGWMRNGQNLHEVGIVLKARKLEETLNTKLISWAESDAKYFKDKLEIRQRLVQKQKDLSAPGKPFALNWQRDLVGERLERNYQDVFNRVVVANEGLKKVYGYTPPQISRDDSSNLSELIVYLDIWIRNSIEWLAAYQQRDQSFTRVISIRSLLSEDVWERLNKSDDGFSTTLTISPQLFANHDNVRLRGIGASFNGEVGTVPWSLTVRLPQNAFYQRDAEPKYVDQSNIPSCLLGRVENRRSFRPLELGGLISLMNASPLGQTDADDSLWLLEIFKPSNTFESFSKVEDVILEIAAVGVPNTGK